MYFIFINNKCVYILKVKTTKKEKTSRVLLQSRTLTSSSPLLVVVFPSSSSSNFYFRIHIKRPFHIDFSFSSSIQFCNLTPSLRYPEKKIVYVLKRSQR